MFSPNPKNDPLLSAIRSVISENDKHREAVERTNRHFKVTDKRQLPHELHSHYDKMISESNLNEKITKSTPMGDVIRDFENSDAPQFEGKSKEKRRQMAIAAKMAMNEALKGNQHKIDANKNNRIDAQDFKMLRNMDEDVVSEAVSNLLEKDNLTKIEYDTIMESSFGQAFNDARLKGQNVFTWNGKEYNSRRADETEEQWKQNLATNNPTPIPKPRRSDRMPEPNPEPVANGQLPTEPVPTNVQQVVPGATPAGSPNVGLVKTRPSDSSWVQTQTSGSYIENNAEKTNRFGLLGLNLPFGLRK